MCTPHHEQSWKKALNPKWRGGGGGRHCKSHFPSPIFAQILVSQPNACPNPIPSSKIASQNPSPRDPISVFILSLHDQDLSWKCSRSALWSGYIVAAGIKRGTGWSDSIITLQWTRTDHFLTKYPSNAHKNYRNGVHGLWKTVQCGQFWAVFRFLIGPNAPLSGATKPAV